MRYFFELSDGREVIAKVSHKLPADHATTQRWMRRKVSVKPIAVYTAMVSDVRLIDFPENPAEDDELIEFSAWRDAEKYSDTDDGHAVVLIEWENNIIELILPGHKDQGSKGQLADVDHLREMVVDDRVIFCFGDGLNRDYAEAGGVELGMNVHEMTRDQLERELDGEVIWPSNEPTDDHWNAVTTPVTAEDVESWKNGTVSVFMVEQMKARLNAMKVIMDWFEQEQIKHVLEVE